MKRRFEEYPGGEYVLSEREMQRKLPGWYAGYWGTEKKAYGGDIFYPYKLGFLGNGTKPAEYVSPDPFPVVIKYWDGKDLLDDKPV